MGRKSQGEVNESLGEHWLLNERPNTTYKSRTDELSHAKKKHSVIERNNLSHQETPSHLHIATRSRNTSYYEPSALQPI